MSITEKGRPAKITFDRRPVENVARSQAENRAIFEDVDFVTVYTPGSSNTIVHKVEEWWDKLDQQVRIQAIPAQYVDEYKKAYESWVSGKEPSVDGTHLSEWTKISRSQAEMWNRVHVRTVEELANANEQTCDAFGMGARAMRDEARAWLASATSGDTLKAEVEELTETVKKQEKLINDLLDKLAESEAKPVKKKRVTKKKATSSKQATE
jgi:hypothetical protein